MNPNTLSPDYIDDHLSVLAQKHCRFVLYYFEESPNDTASIDDLAAYLHSREATNDDVTRTLHGIQEKAHDCSRGTNPSLLNPATTP